MNKVLVCGAGGFIGGHIVEDLQNYNIPVVGVDIKHHEFRPHGWANEFLIRDLRDFNNCLEVTRGVDTVYQLAADMGGAGYVFTGDHDEEIMHNSATINLNMAEACKRNGVKKVFYSSSACVYPERNQTNPDDPDCREDTAYPAQPDSEYGWEKLFSERLWMSYFRRGWFDVKIARFHNVYGPHGTWEGGKEKAPAAMLRKAITSEKELEVWGPGTQTRSFLFIKDCVDMIDAFMAQKTFNGPVNIGSEEMVSINDLAKIAIDISKRNDLVIKNVPGPVGVNGRTSHNNLYREKCRLNPEVSLREGMQITYNWIKGQIYAKNIR